MVNENGTKKERKKMKKKTKQWDKSFLDGSLFDWWTDV